MTKRKPLDDEEQSKRFVETAKGLGVDESGRPFDKALKVVVPAPLSLKGQRKKWPSR